MKLDDLAGSSQRWMRSHSTEVKPDRRNLERVAHLASAAIKVTSAALAAVDQLGAKGRSMTADTIPRAFSGASLYRSSSPSCARSAPAL
jgi:hypothetical protein